MKPNPQPVRTMADRIESQACDKAADLLWNESMDDYAAAIVEHHADGTAHISVATGDSTWDSLRNATQNRSRAEPLAAMRIPDEWRMVDCNIFGRVQMRPIEDIDGIAVAFLFKR